MYKIRFASQADLPRIVEIYNQAILSRNVTGDTVPFPVEARREWFDQHDADHYPLYSCEDANGQVAGFLSLSPYRDRPAMIRTAEVSYYVDYACHHRGIGSALYCNMHLRIAAGPANKFSWPLSLNGTWQASNYWKNSVLKSGAICPRWLIFQAAYAGISITGGKWLSELVA